jgi:hypothetical protein
MVDVWNNKGIVLARMDKYDEALKLEISMISRKA